MFISLEGKALLNSSRKSHRNSGKLDMDLKMRVFRLFVCFTSWTMKMYQWSTTYSIQLQRTRLSRSLVTKRMHTLLTKLLLRCPRRLSFAARPHRTLEDFRLSQIGWAELGMTLILQAAGRYRTVSSTYRTTGSVRYVDMVEAAKDAEAKSA